jgi:hypothetical protein
MFFLVFYSQMFSAACPISYSSEHELCVFSLYCFFFGKILVSLVRSYLVFKV